MSRPLRIEFPDAWYHVMNRARLGQDAFHARKDYSGFMELLMDSSEIFNMRVAAYCLMPSHYHLLISNPRREFIPLYEAYKRGLHAAL